MLRQAWDFMRRSNGLYVNADVSDLPDPLPLTWCERCMHWRMDYCAQESTHWPDDGDTCKDFEREAGID